MKPEEIEAARTDTRAIALVKQWIPGLVIADQASYNRAAELLKKTKEQWSAVEERRRRLVDPLLEALEEARDVYRGLLDGYAEIEAELKARMLAYVASARAAAEQAMREGRPMLEAPPEAQGISIRQKYVYTVYEPEKVPRHLCTPDPKLIKAHYEAGGDPVPGVRREIVESMAAPTGKKKGSK